jgi:hypothetical protein
MHNHGTEGLEMRHAVEMCVEIVEIRGEMTASVAAPGIGLRVEAAVEKVQGLVWKDYAAGTARELPAAGNS